MAGLPYYNPNGPMYGSPIYQQPAPQSYAPSPSPIMNGNIIQVDGEVGARAFAPPPGSTAPFALWDMNDNVVYIRAFNAAGVPMPLRKLRYTEEEMNQFLPGGQSGTGGAAIDTSQFATKDDFNSLRQEIQAMRESNQNGSNGQNRREQR